MRAVASRIAFAVVLACAVALSGVAGAAQGKMGDFMHKPVAAVQRALGARASFLGPDLRPASPPDPAALVQFQSPLPGESFGSSSRAIFVFSKKVRVPELVGMPSKLAKETLEASGLYIQVSDVTCDSGCHVPSPDELDGTYVEQQCAVAGSWIDAGAYVCVVIEPASEAPTALFLFVLVLAGAGFALALVVWLRLRSARDELRLVREGAARSRDESKK